MPLLVAIMGPTASGKTRLAESLAAKIDAQLVSADAFQAYRGMDIGTAKPVDKGAYRLLDLKDPDEDFGLGEWLRAAEDELAGVFAAGRHAIVVGGTGLYVRALFEEYSGLAGRPDADLRKGLDATPIEELRERLLRRSPETAAVTDMANPVRVRRALERLETAPAVPVRLPAFRKLKLGLNCPKDELDMRIQRRVAEMVQNGWSREIESLRQRGFRRDDPGFRAIGYRAIWDALDGTKSLEDAMATTIAETRRYAKRQRTWLRTEPNLVELSAATEQDGFREAMEHINSALM